MTGEKRREVLADLASGAIDVVIGTHHHPGGRELRELRRRQVVIDEQHRFGVEQRAALSAKGDDSSTPDVLVMTAT